LNAHKQPTVKARLMSFFMNRTIDTSLPLQIIRDDAFIIANFVRSVKRRAPQQMGAFTFAILKRKGSNRKKTGPG
jgi:hypothetical protein